MHILLGQQASIYWKGCIITIFTYHIVTSSFNFRTFLAKGYSTQASNFPFISLLKNLKMCYQPRQATACNFSVNNIINFAFLPLQAGGQRLVWLVLIIWNLGLRFMGWKCSRLFQLLIWAVVGVIRLKEDTWIISWSEYRQASYLTKIAAKFMFLAKSMWLVWKSTWTNL